MSRKNIKYQRTPQTHTYTQTHTTKKDWQFIKKIGSKFEIKINLKISICLAEKSCMICEFLHQYKGWEIKLFQLFSHCLIRGIVKWIHCFFSQSILKMFRRSKWNDDYYCEGFICTTEKDGIERPQHILCSVIFPNANLKPFLLNLHIKRLHGVTESGNDNETLMMKKAHFDHQETLPKLWFTSTGNWLKRKKTQIITEELVKPFVLEVVKIILGKDMERWYSNFYWYHQELNCWYEPRYFGASDWWYQSRSHENIIATERMHRVSHSNQLTTVVFYIKNEEVLENIWFFQPLRTAT